MRFIDSKAFLAGKIFFSGADGVASQGGPGTAGQLIGPVVVPAKGRVCFNAL